MLIVHTAHEDTGPTQMTQQPVDVMPTEAFCDGRVYGSYRIFGTTFTTSLVPPLPHLWYHLELKMKLQLLA